MASVIKRGDLHPDIAYLPVKRRLAQGTHDPLQSRIGKMAGEKEEALAHAGFSSLLRRPMNSFRSLKLSATCVASKTFQFFGILKIDPPWKHFYHAIGCAGQKLWRGIAGKDNARDLAFARLGENIAREIVRDSIDEFGDGIRGRGCHDERVIYPMIKIADLRRTRGGILIDTGGFRQIELLLILAQHFSGGLADEEIDMLQFAREFDALVEK